MMVGQQKTSFQDQAEQRLQQEAAGIAKATQTPGQTKEQTKLIAKGIEKGIALYKQQQKQKARELDKARKKALRHKLSAQGQVEGGETVEGVIHDHPRWEPAPLTAACVFMAGALVHGLRYVLGVELIVGGYAVPLSWSLPVALAALGIAIWLLRSARR